KGNAGFVTAATRQNRGRLLMACDAGGVNDGALTASAVLSVVSGSVIERRLAQDRWDVAANGSAVLIPTPRNTEDTKEKKENLQRFFIPRSYYSSSGWPGW